MIFHYAYWSMPLDLRIKVYSLEEFRKSCIKGILPEKVEIWFEEFKQNWAT